MDARFAQGVQVGDHTTQTNYFGVPERVPPESSSAGQQVARLLQEGFAPPPALTGLVARIRRSRWVCVTGGPGSGKSTLLAVLARPEFAPGRVPVTESDRQGRVFAHALVFADATTTEQSLAEDIAAQLYASVPAYRVGVAAHARLDPEDWASQGPLAQLVAGPLAQAAGLARDPRGEHRRGDGDRDDGQDGGASVRILVDGVDQLRHPYADGLIEHLLQLVAHPGLEHVRIVVTVRDTPSDDPTDGSAPGGTPSMQGMQPPTRKEIADVRATGARFALPAPSRTLLADYLRGRRISLESAETLAGVCAGGESAWLLARLISNVWGRLGLPDRDRIVIRLKLATPRERDAVIDDLYDRYLDQLLARLPAARHTGPDRRAPVGFGADEDDTPDPGGPAVQWASRIRPLLAPLAAAGPGPVTPIDLLTTATGIFGGPDTRDRVRVLLAGLGDLVIRVHPDTERELVGLWHPTFAEHLARPGPYCVDVGNAHRILLEQIEILAPIPGPGYTPYLDSPLYRWAADAEPEHLWHLGETSRLLRRLRRRPLPTPRQELDRWTKWGGLFAHGLGVRHPDTLAARERVAAWTGKAGDAAGALRLYYELLPEVVAVLGARHPKTLTIRGNIAVLVGIVGDVAEALRLSRELFPDRIAVLGSRHPDTLATRGYIAHFTGQTGDVAEALRLSRELLPDRIAVLGPRHPEILNTRKDIAAWTGMTGDVCESRRLFEKLLPDLVDVLGPRHPKTLITRSNIIFLIGETGDAGESRRLFEKLLPDLVEVLGPRHPETLITRGNIAAWTKRAGDAAGALQLYRELLPEMAAVLGPRHPVTLAARDHIAGLMGHTGADDVLDTVEVMPDDSGTSSWPTI